LPDFAHTQIPFSLIVSEGRVGVGQKADDLSFALLQTGQGNRMKEKVGDKWCKD
jgi:hypothetical protein